MLNLSFLENSWFFEVVKLNKGELLFDEWDIDDNLYVIKSWGLNIEKYIDSEKKETKLLATLWNSEIFWEWALSNNWPKQVKVLANKNTILLKIEAKNKFEDFLLKHTKSGVDLLSSIIYISNKRLLEANYLITASYKINKYISEINEFNNKNLFKIIDQFKDTINAEYILYIEKHPIIDNYVVLKYDSRENWKLKDIIIDLWDNILDIDDIKKSWVKLSDNYFIQNLVNKNEKIWYLVIADNWISLDEWQKKAISIISVSIAWFVKQKQYFEENKNYEYSHE